MCDLDDTTMFVRFRERNGRLLLSLVETRRIAGKVKQEHVADLGAIDLPPSARDRSVFWPKLHERLSRLSNRIPLDQFGSILGAIHARVPMVLVDEVPSVNKQRAERSLKWWRWHQAMCDEQVELHKQLMAQIERNIEVWSNESARARARIECAQVSIDDPSKPPPGELSRKEINRILRAAGMTKQDVYGARQVARLSEEEFAELLARKLDHRFGPRNRKNPEASS
jgi:hypothetical protein